MLKPSYLVGVASDVVELFSEAEMDIAAKIARSVTTMSFPAQPTEWQKKRNKDYGHFTADVNGIISNSTKLTKREVNRIMKDAGTVALKFDDEIYRMAGLSPESLARSPALQAVLLQGASDTMALMANFTKTMATTANGSFQVLLDRAYMMVMSGGYSQDTAIRLVIQQLASEGISRIAYPSGSFSSVEAATRRAIITGVNQSIAKLQLSRANEMGCKLVEVTSHSGARPSHAVWQGGIYSLEGKHGGYPNFVASTGYGSGDGLCGWNCYHSFFPFFDGLSTPAFSHDPAKDAGKDNAHEYEIQQKQRYYERQVRDAKKACVVYNAALDSARSDGQAEMLRSEFERASIILKRREAAMNDFLNQKGLVKDGIRVTVGGFNRSVSSKAVWANRKAHMNG